MGRWILSPEFAAIGTITSVVALIITLVGFLRTWWLQRRLAENQEMLHQQQNELTHRFAKKVLIDQLDEVQRFLSNCIESIERQDWRVAVLRLRDAQYKTMRATTNPALDSDEEMAIRSSAANLKQVVDYVRTRKIQMTEPSEKFSIRHRAIVEYLISQIDEILFRLDRDTWSHLA